MAIYYVEKVGGTLKSDTAGWPSTTGTGTDRANLQAVNTAASAGDTIIIDGGAVGGAGVSYTGTELDVDSGLTLSKAFAGVRGCKPGDLDYANHGGQITLDSNQQNISCLQTTALNTVEYLKIGNTLISANVYALRNAFNGCVFNHVKTFNCKRALGDVNLGTYNHCTFSQSVASMPNTTGDFLILFFANSTFNYCIFEDYNFLISDFGGAPTYNNCLFLYGSSSGIYNSGATDHTFNNPIVAGCAYTGGNYIIYATGAGKVLINNGNVLTNANAVGNFINPADVAKVIMTDCINNPSAQVSGELPMWVSGRRPAIVVIGCDDAGNIAYFKDVIAAKLEAYGWHGTMATTPTGDYTDFIAVKAAGHDIACHGYRCGSTVIDMLGITIAYAGAEATAQAIVNAGSTTLTLEAPNGNVVGTFDLTSAARDNLSELVTGISAVAGFTGVKTNGDSGLGWSQYLAPGTYNVKPGPTAVDYSPALVYAGELVASKAAIEAGIGSTITSFVCPGNATDADLRDALLAANFTGSRGAAAFAYSMESINIYNIPTRHVGLLTGAVDPTEVQVKVAMAALLELLKYQGGIAYIYAHSVAEFTADGWDKVLAEIKKSGVMVKTLAEASDYIIANGTTADNLTYTRTFTDNSNYALRADSPCVNTGLNTPYVGVASVTDLAGYPITNASGDITAFMGTVDIGAYEWVGVPGLSPTLSLGLGNRPPAWHRRRR